MESDIIIIIGAGSGLGKSSYAQKAVADFVAEKEEKNEAFRTGMSFTMTKLMNDELRAIDVTLPVRGVIPPNFYKSKNKRK